jgi:hypothetical protein
MKHPSRLLGRLLLNPKPINYKLHKNPFPFGTTKKKPKKPKKNTRKTYPT